MGVGRTHGVLADGGGHVWRRVGGHSERLRHGRVRSRSAVMVHLRQIRQILPKIITINHQSMVN